MKTIVAIVVIALGVYFGAKRGWIQGEWLGKMFGLGLSAEQAAVEETVKNTNRKLPAMLNNDISFDKVVSGRKDVVFHYRFVNHHHMAVLQNFNLDALRHAIIQDACSRKDVRDYAFARGYNLQVLVHSSDYQRVLEAYLSSTACGS
jgi:hypothetical protein